MRSAAEKVAPEIALCVYPEVSHALKDTLSKAVHEFGVLRRRHCRDSLLLALEWTARARQAPASFSVLLRAVPSRSSPTFCRHVLLDLLLSLPGGGQLLPEVQKDLSVPSATSS